MSPEERLYCEVFQQKDLLDVEIPLDLVDSVKFVAKSLSKRERRILFFRYWRNYTLKEIGEKLGVTKEKPSTTVNEVSIEAVGFSARTRNVLCCNGIATIGELSKFETMEHLMILPGVGRRVAKEIQRKAALYQIQIRENDKKTTALNQTITKRKRGKIDGKCLYIF